MDRVSSITSPRWPNSREKEEKGRQLLILKGAIFRKTAEIHEHVGYS